MNYSECYHCPLVHPQLDKLSPSDSGRNDLSEGPFFGGYSELREHGTSLTMTGHSSRPPIGTVDGVELDRVYYYTIFPSLLLSMHPDYVMVHYARPIDPGRTEVDLRVALRSEGDRAARLRSQRRRRFLGSHESPGLARERADAARHRVARLLARPLFERRGTAGRVRPSLPARDERRGALNHARPALRRRPGAAVAASARVAERRARRRGRPDRGRGRHRLRPLPLLLRRRGRRRVEDGQRRPHVAERLAAERTRCGRRARDRPERPQRGVGGNGRAQPAQRHLLRRRRLADARRRRALAQRGAARDVGDRADRGRSQGLRARLGGGRRQSVSRQLRAAASIARPTADAAGSRRCISGRRAARPTSRSIRAIRTWSSRGSGSSGACRGASPAAARSTASSNQPTAARRGVVCAATGCPRDTWAGSGSPSPGASRLRADSIEGRRAVAIRRRRRAMAPDDARHAGESAALLHEPARGGSVERKPRLLLLGGSDRDARRRQDLSRRRRAPCIRIITACGSRATAGASSRRTTAARRSRSTAAGRGTGASTSCWRRSTASDTTTRIRITSAAAFRTTTPTAGRPIR